MEIERCLSHPYDRGYWRRYDGGPRPSRSGLLRAGWDACDEDLRQEAKAAKARARPRGVTGAFDMDAGRG